MAMSPAAILQIQCPRQNPGALSQEIEYTKGYREYF
jgi:hypothetical protein